MALDRNHYIGKILAGGFRINRFVGSGAFAYVYQAVAPGGQICAVKIQYNLVSDAKTRFSREIKVLKELPQNDYLVKYYSDGVTPEGFPYLVMEFVDGITLKEALKRRSVWPVKECCDFMLQLCDAFGGLHELGVAHRDVKPDNIMLTKNNQVKLMDLGLIKDAQGIFQLLESEDIMKGRDFAENLDKGVLAGTPEYMAPEQFSDPSLNDESLSKTDTWTDVYSLGLIFYEMLAGKKLFVFSPPAGGQQNEFAKALLQFLAKRTQQRDEEIKPPPSVPYQLWTIIAKALHADPKTRQRNASELADDIQRFLTTGQGVIEQDSDKTCAIDASVFMSGNLGAIFSSGSSSDSMPAVPPAPSTGNSDQQLYAANRSSIDMRQNALNAQAAGSVSGLPNMPGTPGYVDYFEEEDSGDSNFWLWMILILLLIVVAAGLTIILFVL